MKFPFHSLMRMAKRIIIFCAFIILINGVLNGVALAADRNVIIGYYKPVGVSEIKDVQSHGGKVKIDFHLINAVSATLPEDQIEAMKNDSRIKYIVNDTIYRMADEYSSSWGVQYIGSQSVHDQNIDGTGVKIAVLDTGIDYNHPDLIDNYKGGYDFVFNDNYLWDENCLTNDKTCHGTHVSGIIAAEYNGFGVVGVAPGSGIYAVRVLDGSGFGFASLTLSGIEWAVNNGMNIISMSIESDENNPAVLDAVDAAYNSGVLLVAAGGNTNGGIVTYPAAYDSVIAVTAIDQNGQKASFSPTDPKIELAAPGVNINSTVSDCNLYTSPIVCTESYKYLSGTSMAAPHVTGVAALIFSTNFADVNHDGKRDSKDVREIISNTALDTGIPGRDNIYGYGIVDASQAILGTSPYDLAIVRTKTSPIRDAKNISLSQGNYSIKIQNINLSSLQKIVSDNGTVQLNQSQIYTFNGPKEITENLYVKDKLDFVFIPQGKEKSVGYVTIWRKQ